MEFTDEEKGILDYSMAFTLLMLSHDPISSALVMKEIRKDYGSTKDIRIIMDNIFKKISPDGTSPTGSWVKSNPSLN
jgi:hypothetical protein